MTPPGSDAQPTGARPAKHSARRPAPEPWVRLRLADGWLPVCPIADLLPGRGVAALLPDGRQAAVFTDRAGRLYGIDNHDPFTGAAVLSRGLTGTHRGRPYVSSPLLRQRFDLITGECLEDDSVRVATYELAARPLDARETSDGCDTSTARRASSGRAGEAGGED